ncbi:hypothetical protein IJT17_09755, partial [bacterium]|nr:hypothetical protein [bacterium]
MPRRLMLAVIISLLATACSPDPNASVPILSPPDNPEWHTTDSQLKYCTIHSAPLMARAAEKGSRVTV